MPRLFTGIEIPQSQRLLLSMLQSGLKDARWIEPSDFHMTLRFIGDVSPRKADEIYDALDSCSWAAPTIRLGELRVFGSDKPRTIYASVNENNQLNAVASAQDHLMQSLGLAAEKRKFTPHVTLSRLRGSCNFQTVAQYLGEHGGFTAPDFTPERFCLYSAKESTGGGPGSVANFLF